MPFLKDVDEAVSALGPNASHDADLRVFNAVEALYEIVTGVQYRSVATRAVRALEGVCRMLHAQQELVRSVGPENVFHIDVLQKQVAKIQTLFVESKAMIERGVRSIEASHDVAAAALPSIETAEVTQLREANAKYKCELNDALSQIEDLRAINAQLRTVMNSEGKVAPHHGVSFSQRYQRVESLYDTLYRGQGMEMLWHTAMCVYSIEFISGHEAQFREAVAKTFEPVLQNSKEFHTRARLVQTLAGDYLNGCTAQGAKPNTGVVRQLMSLLSIYNPDGGTVFNLAGNYVGDGGMLCIAPLLSRMLHLQDIELADNGLRNASVVALAEALHGHPTRCRVGLADNPFSRPGGKALLSMVNSNRRIVSVVLNGTHVERALRERIESQAAVNEREK